MTRRARSLRRGSVNPIASLLESLEPRQLLSGFEFKTIADVYGIKNLIYDFAEASADPAGSYGAAVAGLGDLNADGYADFAVAWPERSRVDVFSGKDRALIRTVEQAGAVSFGTALENAGDVNGDGVPDMAVGAPAFDADADGVVDRHGSVWIYSGSDGSVIRQIVGTGDADELGFAVIDGGDMNGDGKPDLVVGAPGAGPAGEGRVLVYSGADGAVIWTFTGQAAGDRFGQAVASGDVPALASDTKGDGVFDVLIGAPMADLTSPGSTGHDQGRAYLYDGKTGEVRSNYAGGNADDHFGTSVAIARSTTKTYLLMGVPGFGSVTSPYATYDDAGAVYYYGVDGSFSSIFGYSTDLQLGLTLRTLGDLRDPGRDLVAVGTANEQARVELIEVSDDLVDRALELAFLQPSQLGPSVVAAGDLNGDGFTDLVSGSGTEAGRVVVWSALFANGLGSAAPTQVRGISENTRYVWSTPDYAGSGPGAGIPSDRADFGGFVISNGKLMSTRLVPGLGRAVIFAINNDGLIVGADLVASGTGKDTLGQRFFLKDGVKTYLKDAVKTVVGSVTPNLDTIDIIKLGNRGDLLMQSTTPTGFFSWLLYGGTLTFLWQGLVSDVNDAGTVLGVRWKAPEAGLTVVRYADGRSVDIPKFYDARAINDRGQVAGSSNGELALWDNGTITRVAPNPPTYGTPISGSWAVRDIDNNGRILASLRLDYGYGSVTDYIYTPRQGLKYIYEVVGYVPYSDSVALMDNGWVATARGIAVPTLVGALKESTPVRSIDTPVGTVSVGITDDGQGYVTSSVGGGRLNQVLATSIEGPLAGPRLREIDVYVDPHDGKVYVVGVSDRALHWWQLKDDGYGNPATISATAADTTLVSGLTVFTTRDGRVHIAGLNAAGEVVLYFQNGTAAPDSPLNWSVSNLSKDDLAVLGLDTPAFTGGLTSFVSAWNGLNIVGLDDKGHLQTVWWAPGMTHWRVDDLSAIAGTPELTGTVTGYVTSWGGLNVAGTDADGNVVVAWWAPGMDAWRSDALGDARLTPGSISSYTTPWGGLNIAGLDTNGDVAVAWWAPTSPTWTFEQLGDSLGRFGEDAVGKVQVSGVCAPAGSIELFCRQPADDKTVAWLKEGRMVRLFLDTSLHQWMVEDVSVQL